MSHAPFAKMAQTLFMYNYDQRKLFRHLLASQMRPKLISFIRKGSIYVPSNLTV
jgi:hypothetical protein